MHVFDWVSFWIWVWAPEEFSFFFFSFWIWLLITSSWDSISLPLPCFSCFLSSRVFLRPSVGWRRDDLSSCPSIWWLCNSLEFLVSCHKWRFSVSSRSSAIFQGRCHPPWSRLCVALSGSWAVISDPYSLPSFCPVWPEGPCWWSCASRGQCHFRSVSQRAVISCPRSPPLKSWHWEHMSISISSLSRLSLWHFFFDTYFHCPSAHTLCFRGMQMKVHLFGVFFHVFKVCPLLDLGVVSPPSSLVALPMCTFHYHSEMYVLYSLLTLTCPKKKSELNYVSMQD